MTKQNIVITAASSGIGRATAEAFAEPGVRLVLAARNEEALAEVAAACRGKGAKTSIIPTDVTDAEAVRWLAEQALAEMGTIDVWASIAGIGALGLFHEVPMASHEQTIRTNLIGHMNEAHAILPIFLRQGHGTFINMISLGGFASTPYAAAYGASKFGLRGFSEALRGELADHPRIHICDVYPSFVDTPGIGHAANYTGKALSVPPPVLDTRRVAAAIVRLASRPKPTTMVGSPTLAIRLGHALAPDLTVKSMYRFMATYFDRAGKVPQSDGNLFDPPAEAEPVDGGLRSPPAMRVAGVTAAGAVAALGIGALLWRNSRTQGPDRDRGPNGPRG